MVDESFVPFVPRQLTRASDAPRQPDQSPATPANTAVDMVVQESDAETKTDIESEAQTVAEAQPPRMQAAMVDVPTEVNQIAGSGCYHALEIRREAIRLAAIACGRALRHAVLLHPGVIAAFVDDAIAAAGLPQHARIRVHPTSIAHISRPDHDRIDDDSLSPGDVIVESDDVTLGAGTDTRAGLLVSAAAEA